MKKLLLLVYFVTFTIYSQIPAGYYDTATGTNYTLKTQLYNIILGHTDNGYTPGLWDTYLTSDVDIHYENDGTVLDMYSEVHSNDGNNTNDTDPYNFNFGPPDQDDGTLGTFEGQKYNREHIIPQSIFGGAVTPMVSDAHFITPTDKKVNNVRSNYPHGMVGSATYTSENGSKFGSALNSGYSAGYSGTVFEPIDEFKGDIARMYFYFATRYENLVSGWSSYDMFDGTSNKVFTEPFLTILMTWHTNDPVSTREIDRNNAIYARQNNRNPFIDHPEYVAQIWSTTPDTEDPTAPNSLIASNITNTTVDLNWTASTDNVGVTSYEIFKDGVFLASSATNSYNVTGLTQDTTYNFTVFAKDAFGNTSTVSNTETITTTNIIDVDAPSIPLNLIVSNETSSTIDLSWDASTDNVGVTGYDIYVDGIYNATTVSTTYTITGLSVTTAYSFTVLAKDGATPTNNSSSQSTPVNGTTTAIPSFCGSETFTNSNAPTGGYGTDSFVGDNGVTWSYVNSRDEEGYEITGTGLMLDDTSSKLTSSTVSNGIGEFTCSLLKGFTSTNNRQVSLYINGVLKGTSISWDNISVQTFTVSGINISGDVIIEIRNATGYQVVIDDISWSCYLGTADTEAPTAIVDLSISNTTSTTTNLSWTASTDNVGVTSYEIFKDGVFLASSATNSYPVNGLTASTSYNFTVYVKDAVGNTSLISNTAAVATAAAQTGGNELFISEYVEGGSFNKAIEIANFTSSSINLSVYSIRKETNGNGTWELALNLSGNLNNGEVYVIANASATQAILDPADIIIGQDLTPTNFSGNDVIGLFKNGTLIDIIGVFNRGNTTNFAADTTLRRKSTINSPNTTYTISEWDSLAKDTFDGLGTHTLSTLSTPDFVQNLFSVYPNPSLNNQVKISVQNNTEIEAIQFYNLMGQLVIDIQQPKIIYNKIEVNNIPKGMYIVKIANKDAYSTKRLIVQ